MPFLVRLDPTGKPVYVGGAAQDINTLPEPELQGTSVVDKTLSTRHIASVGGFATNNGTLKAGSLVLEAILLAVQQYREELLALDPLADVYDIDGLDTNLSAFSDGERVGNIFNTFKVNGLNAVQLLYDGTGWFAGGKFSWEFDESNQFQVKIDGEVIARTGRLIDLDIEGILNMQENSEIVFGNNKINHQRLIGQTVSFTKPHPNYPTVGNQYRYEIEPLNINIDVFDFDGNFSAAGFNHYGVRFKSFNQNFLEDEDEAWVALASAFPMPSLGETTGFFISTEFLDVTKTFGYQSKDFSNEPIVELNRWYFGSKVFVNGTVRVANATENEHALNRQTGDERYWQQDNLDFTNLGNVSINNNTTITVEFGGSIYAIRAELI